MCSNPIRDLQSSVPPQLVIYHLGSFKNKDRTADLPPDQGQSEQIIRDADQKSTPQLHLHPLEHLVGEEDGQQAPEAARKLQRHHP